MPTIAPTLDAVAECYARGAHAPFTGHTAAACPAVSRPPATIPPPADLTYLRAVDRYLTPDPPLVGELWTDPAGHVCTVARITGPDVTLEDPDGHRHTHPADQCRPLCDGHRVRAATDHGGE